MSQIDDEYFRQRAVTERALAEAATHPMAIAAHLEMAGRYEALIGDDKHLVVVRIAPAIRMPVAA